MQEALVNNMMKTVHCM